MRFINAVLLTFFSLFFFKFSNKENLELQTWPIKATITSHSRNAWMAGGEKGICQHLKRFFLRQTLLQSLKRFSERKLLNSPLEG